MKRKPYHYLTKMTKGETVSKTTELVKELLITLKTVVTKSYYIQAPRDDDKPPYPYLTFELSVLDNADAKTLYSLEINILGYGLQNNSQIDGYADTVEAALDFKHFSNNKIQFSTYVNSRDTIREEDKNIIRRRLTLEVHLHAK